MPEQPKNPPPQPPLASVEADLFGAIFAFHKKTTTLLRQSSLSEEKLNVVADRIKTLLDNATTEVKRTQQLNVREWLEAAYDEVKRLVEELSDFPDGGKDG
jgi:pyruvate dehydrogenase complex dehydrogenase (E1) component